MKKIENLFTQPMDIIRVLMCSPISVFISHLIFLWSDTTTQAQYILLAVTVSFFLLFIISWILQCGHLDGALIARFFIIATWSVLAHRLFYYSGESGGSLFFQIISFTGLSGYLFFALTGKNLDSIGHFVKEKKNELQTKKQEKYSVQIYEKSIQNGVNENSTKVVPSTYPFSDVGK